jgi:uncharacterized protein YegL
MKNIRILRNIGQHIKPKDLFTSERMIRYFTELAKMVSERYDVPLRVHPVWNPAENDVAYTNNSQIHINLANPITMKIGQRTSYDKQTMLLTYLGLEGHELGHALCTDFQDVLKLAKAWKEHSWYPWRPKFQGTIYEKTVRNIEICAFTSPVLAQTLLKLFKDVSNICEDGYIENFMCKEYRGTFREGIDLLNSEMFRNEQEDIKKTEGLGKLLNLLLYAAKTHTFLSAPEFPFLNDIYDRVKKINSIDDVSEREAVYVEIFVILLSSEDLIKDKQELDKKLSTLERNIRCQSSQRGTGTGGLAQRQIQIRVSARQSNQDGPQGNLEQHGAPQQDKKQKGTEAGTGAKVSTHKPEDSLPSSPVTSDGSLKKQKTNSSGSQSSAQHDSIEAEGKKRDSYLSADASQKDGSGIRKEKSETGKQNGISIDPKAENGKSGKGKPVDWENHDRPEPNQDSAFPKFQDVLPDDPYARLNNKTPIKESEFDGSPLDSCPAAEEILNNVIGTYLDNHKELNLQSISYEVSETAACHANEKSRVRIPEITEKNKSDYSMIYPEVRSCSKKMQRLVKDVLEDREEGGRMTGLLMGNRIIPAYESHQDGRIFSREIMPEDIPPVTVCLLIDESGSMYGLKIAKALETAILLEDFCRGLNLPLAVVGHSEIGYGFTLLNHYVDFEGRSNQKYRLTNMAAHGCNRDGFALRYCMKLLQRRPEEKKLLILISDGQPASLHYTGKVAYADLRAAKKECKLSNITLITAAIDEDKEQIKAIYGADCFLNITDLDKMPKQMVKIVLRMVQ